LLERETPGPALVEAYSQLANAHWIGGHWAEAIAASERAMLLAQQLSLPEPARALGYRGFARAYLGDAGGLDEMQRGLELLVERGAGRDAAILRNNLAVARYPVDGPRRSLAAFEEGITFCEQRGLREAATTLEANCPGLLIELGRPQEALERAARLAAATEASGDTWSLCELRAVELANRVSRGDQEAHAGVEWLIETARTISAADISAFALATAAAALATEAPQRARALLVELEQAPGTHETPYYGRYLPAMVRTALAVGDRPLAERLAEGLKLRQPFDEHARCGARAQLAEQAGDLSAAETMYAEAATRWREFGNVPERAHALLGHGRCLHALGQAGADEPLREARDLFASMGYKPALRATETLLDRIAAAPAS
jgi:tetratricopeptide (TPR) repeat protein